MPCVGCEALGWLLQNRSYSGLGLEKDVWNAFTLLSFLPGLRWRDRQYAQGLAANAGVRADRAGSLPQARPDSAHGYTSSSC
jgi:hypothetical protein